MPVTLANQFQLLRARIETSFAAPYALMISSATVDDGKSVCAQGLAESMASAGHKTLLIDLDDELPRISGLPQIKSLSSKNLLFDVDAALVSDSTGLTMLSLSNSALGATASKEAVSAIIGHLRISFEAIVVEAATVSTSSIALLFANVCDAVILTAREGRPVKSADHATLDALERERANFFGVVTVNQRAIAEFKRRDQQIRFRAAPGTINTLKKIDSPMSKSLVS